MLLSSRLAMPVACLLLLASDDGRAENAQPGPLAAASIIIETNCTDGDSGIQVFIDGDAWEMLRVFGPDGRFLGSVKAQGGFGEVGFTELFVEGDEPELIYPAGLDCVAEDPEMTLEEFLENYPEGTYTFFARTVDQEKLVGTAVLTHDIPNGPQVISPAEGVPQDPNNFVVSWNQGTQPGGIVIVSQQVIVEIEDESTGFSRAFDIQLGAGASSVKVPPELFESVDSLPDPVLKVEVLVKESSGNQTITEREFELGD